MSKKNANTATATAETDKAINTASGAEVVKETAGAQYVKPANIADETATAAPADETATNTAAPAVPDALAALVAQVANTAPAPAPAAAPEKKQAARVIKPDTVAVFLLLMQRTPAAPTFRVNMPKAMRRRARRLAEAKLVINAKNGNGNSMFYLNPAAPVDLVREYVEYAQKHGIKPAREVPNAGRADND